MAAAKDEKAPAPTGSWSRDHLANERTLLAWVRTSLTFMAFGVALAKAGLFLQIIALDHPEHADELPDATHSEVVGALLVAIGGLIAIAGIIKSRRWTKRIGGPPLPERTLTFIGILTIGTGLGLIAYLLA